MLKSSATVYTGQQATRDTEDPCRHNHPSPFAISQIRPPPPKKGTDILQG